MCESNSTIEEEEFVKHFEKQPKYITSRNIIMKDLVLDPKTFSL